jgi:nitroimidazol reductase NimA-like FMN-containing flavoprotein (pyridoxamine 5'-phosphate oxidase superfamily)
MQPMTRDEIHAFIDSRPGWVILTTLGKDGVPHTIPIGYFRIGDDVYIGGRDGTQKMKNVDRNPTVTILFQSGGTMQDIKGVMIQGTGAVIRTPEEFLELSRQAMKWRGVPEGQWPSEARPGAAYIKVTPKKYISWDYSKP